MGRYRSWNECFNCRKRIPHEVMCARCTRLLPPELNRLAASRDQLTRIEYQALGARWLTDQRVYTDEAFTRSEQGVV